jgi:heptosyltransferase-2
MKIIIELPTWLGDSVMATPAIDNLVCFFQNPEITLIGSFVSIETLKNHPSVKKTYIFERNYLKLFHLINSFEDFDLFLSFRSSVRSNILKLLIPSKRKYQFNKKLFKKGHQVERYNNFVNYCLKINTNPNKLIVHSTKKNKKNKTKFLGINPGATYGSSKRWYPREFAKVATELSNQYDIIIFGGHNETDIAMDIERYLIENGINNYENLAAKTSISELVDKISTLDLFITGDSGPMHLAAAFEIPTISIFGPTNEKNTSQWMSQNSTIIKNNLICQPCMKRKCPLDHHKCMKEVKARDVLNEIDKLNLPR